MKEPANVPNGDLLGGQKLISKLIYIFQPSFTVQKLIFNGVPTSSHDVNVRLLH